MMVLGRFFVASVAYVSVALMMPMSMAFALPSGNSRHMFGSTLGGVSTYSTTVTPMLPKLGGGLVQGISSDTSLMLSIPRGGAAAAASEASTDLLASITSSLKQWNSDPVALFNSSLLALVLTTFFIKIIQNAGQVAKKTSDDKEETPESVRAMQLKYLPVFWLFRMAFWMSGPYLFAVFAAKTVNGAPATLSIISKLFLTQFASIAVFGPIIGSLTDKYGRKKASMAAALVYSLGSLSVKSALLPLLFIGRALGGVGQSVINSAPEAWVSSDAQNNGNGKYLGSLFGLAYSIDALVAISAGQIAGWAAGRRGPTGPFELCPVFLGLGALIAALTWKENVARQSSDKGSKGPSIGEAFSIILNDPKVMMVGAIQSLFESAMYIFVLQWPQDMGKAVAKFFGESTTTPFGTVFSCFMACCLLGSTLFGQLSKWSVPTERTATAMLAAATLALAGATSTVAGSYSLAGLIASFFVFEACVGMYFPSIATLFSKYLPDSHRSGIMSLFGVTLNGLVVSVYLSISKLGSKGAMAISTTGLAIATLCSLRLQSLDKKEATKA